MDLIIHNPVADMYGPDFLAFYAAVIAAAALACRVARRALDWTGATPPAVPPSPDPHEVAYLRGGENEVARSLIFTLVQRGLLQVRQEGSDYVVEPSQSPAERRALSPIERRALDWFAAPQKISRIFQSDGLAAQLRPFCASYEQHLQRENLLPTRDMLGRARLLRWAAALLVLGLGSYKLLIALSRGRYNVMFLVGLAVIGVVLIFKATRLPRLSRRGRAYLERLQLAFERLKNSQPAAAPAGMLNTHAAPAFAGAGGGGPALAAYDPTLPLLVGVFGVGALAGTQYDYFQQSFRRSALDGGSGGAGCGSSCGSSDSSSGGSSCGSSCGGGCGGCGS